ncbi:MAG: hypothetical protein CO093_11445 [Alphaproteobacteria bacterium CG_4_9_14_3_um_filter_47_13]|nr:MAG: hypothetical protein CO093_11445 [Alphaproteobacteria bacterium CG_4_9_14_3_um_filter_47_13]
MSDMTKENFQKAVKEALDAGIDAEQAAVALELTAAIVRRYAEGTSAPGSSSVRQYMVDKIEGLKR